MKTSPSKATAPASKKITLERFLPWLLIIAGTIALICSFVITLEKIHLLQDANYKPPCNLNPVISCSSVMASKQAATFGFPNPFLGLAAFAVLITLGVVLLSGSKLKRWLWWGLEAGTLFGVGFVHWLFFESVYRIQSLCPYCIVVWALTITTFWYVTLYNLQLSFDRLPPRAQTVAAFARRHHLDILAIWLLTIAALILKHFWYYYGRAF